MKKSGVDIALVHLPVMSGCEGKQDAKDRGGRRVGVG